MAEFYATVMSMLSELGLQTHIQSHPNEVESAVPFADDVEHASYDPEAAHLFWRQLVQAHRVLGRFRSRFVGKVSPVHFFWGAMDLACTRFSGRSAPTHPGGAPNCGDWVMVEGYSHTNSAAAGSGRAAAPKAASTPTPTRSPMASPTTRFAPPTRSTAHRWANSSCPTRWCGKHPIRTGFCWTSCKTPMKRRRCAATGIAVPSKRTRTAGRRNHMHVLDRRRPCSDHSGPGIRPIVANRGAGWPGRPRPTAC